uniref:Uncharacterized protein n=2 Tax=Chrysotila carterae TaxID=13221 RepID=A0A7S4B544_CHRCT
MSACLALLSEAPASASGHFYQSTSTSPLRNSAGAHTGRWSRQAPPPVEHSSASSLAPMGTSHLGSGAQYKAFPAHWGEPPNSPMKGHHGVIRDLPNGYGRGNAALERWVSVKHPSLSNGSTLAVSPFSFGLARSMPFAHVALLGFTSGFTSRSALCSGKSCRWDEKEFSLSALVSLHIVWKHAALFTSNNAICLAYIHEALCRDAKYCTRWLRPFKLDCNSSRQSPPTYLTQGASCYSHQFLLCARRSRRRLRPTNAPGPTSLARSATPSETTPCNRNNRSPQLQNFYMELLNCKSWVFECNKPISGVKLWCAVLLQVAVKPGYVWL